MPAILERKTETLVGVAPAGPAVWERLWRLPTPAFKDDWLLARERISPRFRRVVEFLESTFGELTGLRTIELGCGRGDLSALLAQRGAQVTLLDASGAALGQARRRFERLQLHADSVNADLLASPGPLRERFDVALSSGVIEHFRGSDRMRAIAAHAAFVREGGAVAISVPNAWCLPYRLWKLYLEMRGCWPYGLEIPYSTRELRGCAQRTGLSVVVIAGLGFWQSIGDHWVRGVMHRHVDWVERAGPLDQALGMSLLLLACKPRKTVTPATLSKGDSASANDIVERHFERRGLGCEFEMEADWIRAHLPRHAKRVIDLGCGGGGLFPTIGGQRVIGVDYEPRGLSRTRSRFPGSALLCASAASFPFAERSVDALVLQHVIEHLPAAQDAARQWLGALRPGGTLLVLTPNAGFVDPTIFDDPTHVRLFARDDLAELIQGAGFEIVDLRTLGLPWFRKYQAMPAGWRLRRCVTRQARALSWAPGLRWRGQTLCCAARRPDR